MITKIIEKLKTGAVKNVVPFGVTQLPKPPYIVVKPESRKLNRAFRIIVHFPAECITDLEDYTIGTVDDLLSNFAATDRHGNDNALYTEGDYGDIITGNDDGTIAMERVYLMPQNLTF